MELLFEIKTRTNPEPALLNSNTFEFYDNSSRDKVELIRNLLNEWYANFPDKGKKDLKGRFLKSFDSAFFELFVFTLFKKNGFTIEIHPDLKYSSSQPDFLIQKGSVEFYVEAKVTLGESEEEIAKNNILNELYDEINKIRFCGYYLSIKSVELLSSNQPSARKIIKSMNEFHLKIEEGSQKKEFNYDDKDISLKIIFLFAKNYSSDIRPIAIYPNKSWWGSGETNLQKKIIDKSKKYQQLSKPFLLFINTLDKKSWNTNDIDSAILGSSFLFTDDSNTAENNNPKDIIFNKSNSLNKVNGLFITRIFPNNIPIANYWFYKNYNSKIPFDLKILNFQVYEIDKNTIIREVGSNLDKLLNLPYDWLDL